MGIIERANQIVHEHILWQEKELRDQAQFCGCNGCIKAYNAFISWAFDRDSFWELRIPYSENNLKPHKKLPK